MHIQYHGVLKHHGDFIYSLSEDQDVQGYSCLTNISRDEFTRDWNERIVAVDFWDYKRSDPYLGVSSYMKFIPGEIDSGIF